MTSHNNQLDQNQQKFPANFPFLNNGNGFILLDESFVMPSKIYPKIQNLDISILGETILNKPVNPEDIMGLLGKDDIDSDDEILNNLCQPNISQQSSFQLLEQKSALLDKHQEKINYYLSKKEKIQNKAKFQADYELLEQYNKKIESRLTRFKND